MNYYDQIQNILVIIMWLMVGLVIIHLSSLVLELYQLRADNLSRHEI
jgi:hypothetical protein